MRKKLAAAIFVLACSGMYAQVSTVDVAYAVVALARGRNAVPIARPSYDRLPSRVPPAAPQHPAATENIEDTSGPHRE
jgi:hypothetical protein